MHEIIKLLTVILMDHSQYKLAIWFGSIIVLRQIYANVSHGHFGKQIKGIDDQLISLIKKLGKDNRDEPRESKRQAG